MEIFTLGPGDWLRRLFAQSPLVRVSDRIEAATLVLLVVFALVATPVAGAVGTATYDSLARKYATDRSTRHQVVATVTDDSILSPEVNEEPFLTDIAWNFMGAEHIGEARTYRMKTGDTTSIWIDDSGDQTGAPLTDENAASEAVVTALALWFIAVGAAAAAWTLLRLRLDRFRYAAWDRELDDLAGHGRASRNT